MIGIKELPLDVLFSMSTSQLEQTLFPVLVYLREEFCKPKYWNKFKCSYKNRLVFLVVYYKDLISNNGKNVENTSSNSLQDEKIQKTQTSSNFEGKISSMEAPFTSSYTLSEHLCDSLSTLMYLDNCFTPTEELSIEEFNYSEETSDPSSLKEKCNTNFQATSISERSECDQSKSYNSNMNRKIFEICYRNKSGTIANYRSIGSTGHQRKKVSIPGIYSKLNLTRSSESESCFKTSSNSSPEVRSNRKFYATNSVYSGNDIYDNNEVKNIKKDGIRHYLGEHFLRNNSYYEAERDHYRGRANPCNCQRKIVRDHFKLSIPKPKENLLF